MVNESNELKVVDTRSKELVFSVLTRRPFLMNELQLWEDGVATISRHRDAVFMIMRASTRRVSEPQPSVVRHRRKAYLVVGSTPSSTTRCATRGTIAMNYS